MIDINALPHLPGAMYIYFSSYRRRLFHLRMNLVVEIAHGGLRLNLALYFNTILMHRIPVSTQNIKAAEIPEPLIVKAANHLVE